MKRSTRPLHSAGREAPGAPIPLAILAALIGAAAAFGHLGYQIGRDRGRRERERSKEDFC
jgi:hypothetical protein